MKIAGPVMLSLFVLHLFAAPVFAEEMSNYQLMQEMMSMKKRLEAMEATLAKKDQRLHELEAQTREMKEQAESASEEAAAGPEWMDRLEFSGAVEVEFGSEKQSTMDPGTGWSESVRNEDLTLATVELGVDAFINPYTTGHVLFLYEEDEDADRVRLDEGTIRLGGIEETMNLYFQGGAYYPHFSELNSWFVSDPLTLELFEIRESAAEVGYDGEWVSAGLGAFHGDIEDGFEDESRINGFFADANIHNPEGTLGGLSLLAGASYINNVADTDTLQEEVQDLNGDGALNDLGDTVGGAAVYLVAEYGIFGFGAEYITALDDFRAGEMGFAVDRNGVAREAKPAAWNLEAVLNPVDPLLLGVKYEGTKDMFGLAPDRQYGVMAGYEIFEYTTLSAEYLHGDYDENHQNGAGGTEEDRNAFTLQLAIEF